MSSEDTVFDYGPEWRAYTPEEKTKRSRAGPPLTLLDPRMGVGSFVDGKMGRINASVVNNTVPKEVREALEEVKKLCRSFHLPDHVCENAAYYARKIVGKRTRWMVLTPERAALIGAYFAARTAGLPVAASLLHMMINSLPKKGSLYTLLQLGMKFAPPSEEYVARLADSIADIVGLKGPARIILVKASITWHKLLQRRPRSAIGAALYVATRVGCDHTTPLTMTEAGAIVGQSDHAIRKIIGIVKPVIIVDNKHVLAYARFHGVPIPCMVLDCYKPVAAELTETNKILVKTGCKA